MQYPGDNQPVKVDYYSMEHILNISTKTDTIVYVERKVIFENMKNHALENVKYSVFLCCSIIVFCYS